MASDDSRAPANSSPPAGAQAPPQGFSGAIWLFNFAGINVYIHWSWFAAAYFLIRYRPGEYSSFIWNVAEYVAIFGIVLLHEFGHVLACRQVGGTADRILLWPLGGLAFVAPPPRPGALFWTTAAGPFVNVLLAPIFFLLALLTERPNFHNPSDLNRLLSMLFDCNLLILLFNLLPIFPLDGGRLLNALLWRLFGRVPGLKISAGIGVLAGVALGVVAMLNERWWFVLMAAFLVYGGFSGLAQARLIARMEKVKFHADLACPNCGAPPPFGPYWECKHCSNRFDLLAPAEGCPNGGDHECDASCFRCGQKVLPDEWKRLQP